MPEKETHNISPQWAWLIRTMEEERVSYGEARIIMQNGEPVEIVELLRRQRYKAE